MKRNVAIGTGLLALLVALGLTQSMLQRSAGRAGQGRRAGAAVRSRPDVAEAAAQPLGATAT